MVLLPYPSGTGHPAVHFKPSATTSHPGLTLPHIALSDSPLGRESDLLPPVVLTSFPKSLKTSSERPRTKVTSQILIPKCSE